MFRLSPLRQCALAFLFAQFSFLLCRADEAIEFTPPPLQVPDGFVVDLVAAPPLVKHPMMACLDERGRLFIAESSGKNLQKEALLEQRCRFIRMLEDTDADGQFDKSTIFADRLVMPEGAQWYQGSLYVLSSPYLWRFEDTDGDGVADVREKLLGRMELTGAANQHGAYLGPNGRLYFSGGAFGYKLVGSDGSGPIEGAAGSVFSCRPDGSDVQVFGYGTLNPVEVVFTSEGELIASCAIFDRVEGRHDALVHWVRGAASGGQDFQPPVIQPTGLRMGPLSYWGRVAPAGLARYRGTSFGPGYHNSLFTCLFNTNKVVHSRIRRWGATFQSENEDFVTSTSKDFRPTDVLEDADGSLLLVDTGGWFTISCPNSKVAKPQILGAIYRIRRAGAPPVVDCRGTSLEWERASSDQLAGRLDDPRPVVRDRSIDLLSRQGDNAVGALELALTSESVQRRRNAVWALSRIGTDAARAVIRVALSDPDQTVAQAAIRSAGVLRDARAETKLIHLVASDKPPIRRAAATALGQIGPRRAVPILLEGCALAADNHSRHALIYALIEIGDFNATLAGLTHSDPQVQQAALVAVNQIDGQRLRERHVAPLLESDDALLRRTALEIVTAREGWSDQIIGFLERLVAGEEAAATDTAIAQAAILTFSDAPRVQAVLHSALSNPNTPDNVQLLLLEAIGRLTELPESWIKPLAELLVNADDQVRMQTIETISSLEIDQLDDDLKKLASQSGTPQRVRVAAWCCLAGRGLHLPDEAFGLLMTRMTNDEVVPLERLAAAKAVASSGLDSGQLVQVARATVQLGPLELPTLLGAFRSGQASDAQLARVLLDSLDESPVLSALSVAELEPIFQSVPDDLQADASRILNRLQEADAQALARIKQLAGELEEGNVERGKRVFFSNRAACSACHRVQGEGGSIGPDLSDVGRIRTRQDLLESVLLPSSTIVANFETYALVTRDGHVHRGVIKQTTTSSVILRNAQRKEIIVQRDQIEEMVRSTVSIMPQGLDKTLSRRELSDLLAYLGTLRPAE